MCVCVCVKTKKKNGNIHIYLLADTSAEDKRIKEKENSSTYRTSPLLKGFTVTTYYLGFLGDSVVKNPIANAEMKELQL